MALDPGHVAVLIPCPELGSAPLSHQTSTGFLPQGRTQLTKIPPRVRGLTGACAVCMWIISQEGTLKRVGTRVLSASVVTSFPREEWATEQGRRPKILPHWEGCPSKHTHTHTHTHAHTQSRTHPQTHTHTQSHTPEHTHIPKHAHAPRHTHAPKHTHTQNCLIYDLQNHFIYRELISERPVKTFAVLSWRWVVRVSAIHFIVLESYRRCLSKKERWHWVGRRNTLGCKVNRTWCLV